MTQSDRRLLSLVFLCLGVLVTLGSFSPTALICVLISVGLGVHSLSSQRLGPVTPRWARILFVSGLAGATLLYSGRVGHSGFLATFLLLAGAILVYSLARRRAAKVIAAALAGLSATGGLMASMAWGFADIDVFHFQQEASQALLHGHNPYAPVVLSPEMVAPGVPALLHLHLPYGPILPVLEAPFRAVGDIRMLHILAGLAIAVATLWLAWRAGTLDQTACVVMAFPLTLGMVLFSWVDVITMAGFSVWIVLFRSHPKSATLALAVALGVKPTTLIALVPILFWSIAARRQVSVAAGLAALFTLPFAIATGASQFFYNVIGVQLAVFPRVDALTIDSLLNAVHLPILPTAVSAAVIALTAIGVMRRRPASYGELLTGTAVLATVSFLVAKWAYFNYYYIPAVLLMLAIAGDGLAVDSPEMISPPAPLRKAVGWLREMGIRLPPVRSFPSVSQHGPWQ